MLEVVAVWYLLVTTRDAGVTSVPQADRAQCVANAKWLNDQSPYDNEGYLIGNQHARCIPGVLYVRP